METHFLLQLAQSYVDLYRRHLLNRSFSRKSGALGEEPSNRHRHNAAVVLADQFSRFLYVPNVAGYGIVVLVTSVMFLEVGG